MRTVLAIDAGTTGNRVVAVSKDGDIVAKAYYEFPQIFPQPGWVEHNPRGIWETTLKALREVVVKVGVENIDAMGITNQRETTVIWDRQTGEPVMNAIVWQCRRTSDVCARLQSYAAKIKEKTGLFLDPYFSATKIQWILDHVNGVRKRAERGEVIFGTVDSWILWNLTGGKVHATESSNASRTLCYNINTLDYDSELLDLFRIPRSILPEVKESGNHFGNTSKNILGREIPITGILGDQQASLFAQGGWQPGVVKNTYGTGLFVMTSTGKEIPHSGRLVNTIAWKLHGEVYYGVEGSVFVGGSAVQWLRDGLKIIESAAETEKMAVAVRSNEGVYFVPALVGLGAPYWNPNARGMLIGMTRGTTRNHLVRATLESLAYQTRDVIEEMKKGMPADFKTLRVDGGAVQNNFLMQFQADILGCEVERPILTETTGMGVAALAGVISGFWTRDEFLSVRKVDRTFTPSMEDSLREKYYGEWGLAALKSFDWSQGASYGS